MSDTITINGRRISPEAMALVDEIMAELYPPHIDTYPDDLLAALAGAEQDVDLDHRDALVSTREAADKCGITPAQYRKIAKAFTMTPTSTRTVTRNGHDVQEGLWADICVELVNASLDARAARLRRLRRQVEEEEEVQQLVTVGLPAKPVAGRSTGSRSPRG
jgi:hypothetical protein